MKTLLVPDIHEEYPTLVECIEPLCEAADRVVFLGDYLDTFRNPRPGETMRWVKERLGDEKYTFLMGNHDAQYRWHNAPGLFRCSGYRPQTEDTCRRLMTQQDWNKFRLYTHVGPWLVSHAGLCTYNMPGKSELASMENAAVLCADMATYHPWWAIGQSRDGGARVGGILWQDFNIEFSDVEGRPQIVGHTKGKEPRQKGASFCIDTALHDVAWVEDLGRVCTRCETKESEVDLDPDDGILDAGICFDSFGHTWGDPEWTFRIDPIDKVKVRRQK